MKITKSKLKQIIKEELSRVMREDSATDTKREVEHLEKHGPKWVLKYYNEYLDISQYYNKIAKESGYHLKINVGFEDPPNYVADGAENTYNWHVYYTIEAQDKNRDVMEDDQGYPLDGGTEYGALFGIEGHFRGWTPKSDLGPSQQRLSPRAGRRQRPADMEDYLDDIIGQLQRADRYE